MIFLLVFCLVLILTLDWQKASSVKFAQQKVERKLLCNFFTRQAAEREAFGGFHNSFSFLTKPCEKFCATKLKFHNFISQGKP